MADEDQNPQGPPPVPPTGGQTYFGPGDRPGLPPDAQSALQGQLAADTAGPARPMMPGGAPEGAPDLSAIYRTAFSHLPVDQAIKAVQAAVQYQGQRGFQNDLAAGKSSAEAMAKWGPLLFHSNPAAMVNAAKLAQQPQLPTGPVQAQPILDPSGKPIPGQYTYTAGGKLQHITGGGGMTPYQEQELAMRKRGLDIQEKRAADAVKQSQRLYALRQEEKELSSDPMVTAEISPKATPARRAEMEKKKARLAKVQEALDKMVFGAGETTPAQAQPTSGQVPPKDQRVVGQNYKLPKGTYTWTSDGWVKAASYE